MVNAATKAWQQIEANAPLQPIDWPSTADFTPMNKIWIKPPSAQ